MALRNHLSLTFSCPSPTHTPGFLLLNPRPWPQRGTRTGKAMLGQIVVTLAGGCWGGRATVAEGKQLLPKKQEARGSRPSAVAV